jgi:hypothetical protein
MSIKRLTAIAFASLASLSAHALEDWQAMKYTYTGNNFTTLSASTKNGHGLYDVDRPGVTFSMFTPDYLQPGQKVSFRNDTAVLDVSVGSQGEVTSWKWGWCNTDGYCKDSVNKDGVVGDHYMYYQSGYNVYSNFQQPGTWTTEVVAAWDAQSSYFEYVIPASSISAVPEADAGLMTLGGLSLAIIALARRRVV